MAKRRYRKVFPDMRADEEWREISPLPPCAQGLWLEVLTGKQTDIIGGLFEIGESGFADQLRWPLKSFRAVFSELAERGWIKADWSAQIVWAPRVFLDNVPDNPKVVLGWANAWRALPECELKCQAYRFILQHLKERGPKFVEAFHKVCGDRPEFGYGMPNGMPDGLAEGMAYQEQQQEQEQEQEQQQQKTPAAAACAAHGKPDGLGSGESERIASKKPVQAIEETITALNALGMISRERPLAVANPGLARAVASHCAIRFKDPKQEPVWTKPGYIRDCFLDPAKFGFELVDGDWKEPPDQAREKIARRAESQKQRAHQAALDRQENERRMDVEAERFRRWDQRPEPIKEKIRGLVRSRGDLWANKDNDAWTFKSACMNMAEEMEREGVL